MLWEPCGHHHAGMEGSEWVLAVEFVVFFLWRSFFAMGNPCPVG